MVSSTRSVTMAALNANRVESPKRNQEIGFDAGKYGTRWRPRPIRDADRTVLECRIDGGFADLPDQLVVELPVGLGLVFQRLVIERPRVEPIEFGAGFRDLFPQHVFAVQSLPVLHFHALGNADFASRRAAAADLSFVPGRADIRDDFRHSATCTCRELPAGVAQKVGESFERVALGGGIRGAERSRPNGIPGRFFEDAIAFGGVIAGIELQKARRLDAGFLIRVNDVEFSFKIGEALTRSLHFCLQLIQLSGQKEAEFLRGVDSNPVGVLEIGVGDRIGDVGGEARAAGAILTRSR